MRASKPAIPTLSYPEDHEVLAKEFDKVLSRQRVKENLSKIDQFLARVLEPEKNTAATRKPKAKK